MADLGRKNLTITDEAGNLQTAAWVKVFVEGPGLPTAILYTDRAGTTTKGNPFQLQPEDEGVAWFYAVGGRYRIIAYEDYTDDDTKIAEFKDEPVGSAQAVDVGAYVAPGYFFQFETATVATGISAGAWRANNADLSLATTVWISDHTAQGSDVTTRLLELDPVLKRVLNTFMLREQVGGGHVSWRVSAAVDSGAYITLTVEDHDGETAGQVGTYGAQFELSGDNGRGVDFDDIGLFSGRAAHNAEVKGYGYLSLNGNGSTIERPVVYYKKSNTSADWSDEVYIEGVPGLAGEPLVAVISKSAGSIPAGEYALATYYHGEASMGHVYGEVLSGTGSVICYIDKNGVTVYGPFQITDFAPFDASDLVLELTVGDRVDLILQSADATVLSFTAQIDGSIDPEQTRGLWTPGISFNNASVGVTYAAANSGRWTKDGKLVTAQCNLILSNKGSSTGDVRITGLPFLSRTDTAILGSVHIDNDYNMASITGAIGGMVESNAQTVLLAQQGATGMANLTNANITNTSQIRATIIYEVP